MFDCTNLISSNTFTSDQKKAITSIFSFLNSNNDILIVNGAAGTGKTYIIAKIIEYLKSEDSNYALVGKNVFLAAPTGKASLVLTEKLKQLNIHDIEATTIHRLIYQLHNKTDEDDKEDIDSKKEEEDKIEKVIYILKSNRELKNCIYFIDESSMISDNDNEDDFISFGSGKLLSDLFSFVWDNRESGNKIIFIADKNQLPPVPSTDNVSIALSPDILKKKNYLPNGELSISECSLNEVVRQKQDSQILKVAHKIIF